MKIPLSQNLFNQSFRSNQIEFVWVFKNKQFICVIRKDGSVYIEAGEIDALGNYIGNEDWEGRINIHNVREYKMWDGKHLSVMYNNFTNGDDMIDLIHDCLVYLK